MLKKILTTVLIGAVLFTSMSFSTSAKSLNSNSKGLLKVFMNNPQHTGVSNSKAIEKFTEVKWKFKTNGRIFASPIILDNVAYVGSADKNFYAVDINTGKEIWKFKTDGEVNSTAVILDNKAYFASTDGYFYAVNIQSGKEVWKFKTQGEKMKDIWDYYLSSPVIQDNTVYFGSGDSYVYALDIRNGKLQWKFKTNNIVHASPAINNNVLYIGSYDGYMYALDVNTGELKWKFKTVGDAGFPDGAIQGSASVANGMVYFGSRDFNVYALNEKNGKGMWNYKVPFTWVISTPSVKEINKEKMLYFGTSDGCSFNALSALYGDQIAKNKWTISVPLNVFGGCTITENIGYFGGFDGRLYAVDLVNKNNLWTYQTNMSKENYSKVFDENGNPTKEILEETDYKKQYEMVLNLGSILSTPAVEDGVIYFGSTDGYLYAIR